jgi:hypothetical protein
LSGRFGGAHKTDASIVTFTHPSILCPFTSITSWHVSMAARLFLRISLSHVFTAIGTRVRTLPEQILTRARSSRLFHPRVDKWNDHFEWTAAALAGRTAIGPSTIHVLAINDAVFLAMRGALIQEQVFRLK